MFDFTRPVADTLDAKPFCAILVLLRCDLVTRLDSRVWCFRGLEDLLFEEVVIWGEAVTTVVGVWVTSIGRVLNDRSVSGRFTP